MKIKLKSLLIYLFVASTFVINVSFSSVPSSITYGYIPVFMERSELEKSVSYQYVGRDLIQPGKIYYKAPYIYINERYKGIHVINNTNPSTPVNEAFIVAPGCIDMAVKGNVMYLDNSVDLVAFDLTTKQVTKRIKNVFPEPVAPPHSYYYDISRPANYILVGWKKNTDK